jgi:streptogramin lyase
VPGLEVDAGIVAQGGSVWVADEAAAVVYRLDARSGEVQAAIPAPIAPGKGYLVEHDSAPWYIDALQGSLVRVDPATDRAALLNVAVTKPSAYWGIAASTAAGPPGRMWIRSGNDEVWLLDTRRDRVLRRLAVQDGRGGDLQEVGGALWVAGFSSDSVERIPL